MISHNRVIREDVPRKITEFSLVWDVLPVISLDALNTELWVTHVVNRSQAWGLKSQDFASCEYTEHSSY